MSAPIETRQQPDPQEVEMTKADIVIAGAGYVGLACAVAIASARPSLKIIIVDAAPECAWKRDTRAAAIAAAARRMLLQIGCWDGLDEKAQPINRMTITDSRMNDPVRPVYLTFDGPEEGQPFAHMIANVDLNGALRDQATKLGVTMIEGAGVASFQQEGPATHLTLSDGRQLSARLLVAADGVRSRLRDQAGIKTVGWQYGQSGIVCTVLHERPHHGEAIEHFLPSGPFAILPLPNGPDGQNRSSIVWTERTEDADRLVNENDLVFETELERRFGLQLGEIRVEGTRRAWPLGLLLARDFVRPRFALAGDAAHGIHPVAGQGLNLGFKDAAALAETIVEADRLGQDIGAMDVLEKYQQWRRFDTVQMAIMTDVLTRLFSNDSGPLRMMRTIGLGLVERMPRMKDYFMSQAAGEARSAPKLLQGEPI